EDVLWWAMICNSHNPATGGHLFPNTLDKAIWSHKLGRKWSEKIAAIKVIKAVDFSFETRTMSVTVNNRGEELEVIKGQSEAIFSLCKLSKIEKEKAKLLVGSKEKKGLKVLAIATRSNKSGIKLRGFLTFEDKVRNDLKNVFSELDKLNVSLKIITGDNMEITRSVCIQAGLEILGGRIIMGKEIEKANDSQLQETVKKYNIFAKTTPKDKQRIILAMRRNGHNVGYMGDGVNDVGALKSADVAIAVGNANDICKDVADIVLMRTDLDLIVKAVVMGRKVFANTTKFIANTMSSSFGNVISITISSVFLKFIPMLPSQVLLIDSLSDIQHLTIANDNVDVENLKKPNHWDVNKIGKFMVIFGLISTIFDLITMFTFSRFVWDPELFRSIWYIESNLTELLATFSIRTRRSMFGSKPGTGLIITSAAAILISFIAPYTKIGEELFGFQSVDFQYVIIVIAIVAVYIAILEYAKEYWYRNNG
ncbi:MAG TPA: HAD-IC family P-type ATPase, partial [Patescibacteria group bacterium]